MKPEVNEYLKNLYFKPENGSSYASPRNFYNEIKSAGIFKVSFAEIKQWLQDQEAYSIYKPTIRKFARSRIVVAGIDDMWEADLADMQDLASENSGVKYILVVVDVLSKFLWATPLYSKTSPETARGMKVILDSTTRRCNVLRTDAGGEFTGRKFQEVLKQNGIHHTAARNETKAAVAERSIKTLKTKIFKYITHTNSLRYEDELADIVLGINRTIHRTIGMKPADVNGNNAVALWWKVYAPKEARPTKKRSKYAFSVGERVRISFTKNLFDRAYSQKWTREIFIIEKRFIRDGVQVYKLKDWNNDTITGTFYKNELQMVNVEDDGLWKIEKVLKTRKRRGRPNEYFVKFLGWPKKFNSWVEHENVNSL